MRAINSINSNVWAFLILLVGVFLVIHKVDSGKELIAGGFVLLRSGANTNIEHADGIDASVKVGS